MVLSWLLFALALVVGFILALMAFRNPTSGVGPETMILGPLIVGALGWCGVWSLGIAFAPGKYFHGGMGKKVLETIGTQSILPARLLAFGTGIILCVFLLLLAAGSIVQFL